MSLLLPSQIYAAALFGVNSDPICEEIDQVANLGSPVIAYDYAKIILKNSPLENSLQLLNGFSVSSTRPAGRSTDVLEYDIMTCQYVIRFYKYYYCSCS